MPIQSRWNLPIPEVSLQRWVFESSFDPLPDTPIYHDANDPSIFLTIAGFRLQSKRIALGLVRAGLRPGDRVLIFSGNHLYFPAVFMGVLMAGGIFTGANPSFGVAELAAQLQDSAATFMIAGEKTTDIAVQAANKVGLPASHIYDFGHDEVFTSHLADGSKGTKHWNELLANADDAAKFDWVEPEDPRAALCCLNYSSGTTGRPKGVEVTHYSYVAHGVAAVFMRTEGTNAQEQEEIAQTSKGICILPMYHAAGQTVYIAINTKMRTPMYIMPKFNFESMLKHIQHYKITAVGAVPPILIALVKSPLTKKYDLSSIRSATCGAAPLASDVLDASNEILFPYGEKQGTIQQGWGMTELTCLGLSFPASRKERTNSVGEAVPNAMIKLMANGKEVTTPGERGELWFSGPIVMKGYWNNPIATADTIEADENGTRWLKTGDIAYVDKYDAGALVYLVDRAKELIKVRGFQVSPTELESALLERDDIADVGVVGVGVDGEEAPRAYIVRKKQVSEEEIVQWMQQRVAKYKWLRGGVIFIEAIPRNSSGKIMRRDLRELAKRKQVMGQHYLKTKL